MQKVTVNVGINKNQKIYLNFIECLPVLCVRRKPTSLEEQKSHLNQYPTVRDACTTGQAVSIEK